MKEIQTNGITLLLVEVPEDASDFRIDYASIIVLSWATTNENGSIELSSGKWVILGKSTELSEEQMKEIMTLYEGKKYKVYTGSYGKYTDKVQQSYLSLLEANGIDNNKSHLVLKRI